MAFSSYRVFFWLYRYNSTQRRGTLGDSNFNPKSPQHHKP